MLKLVFLSIACVLALQLVEIQADTPANCSYEDIRGAWVFYEGERRNDKSIVCDEKVKAIRNYTVSLEFPNLATDSDGNIGFWTIIYNQGFEVVINHRKYFAFSYFTQSKDNTTSYCDQTFWGWAHETGVNPSDWSCYKGLKVDSVPPKVNYKTRAALRNLKLLEENKLYKKNVEFVNKINSVQDSWKAVHYDFLENKKISELINMAGGKKSKIIGKPKPAPIDSTIAAIAAELPDSFDWRNVSGQSYVSPVRNQNSCGSCYAFSSMAMNEARLRVKTGNAKTTVFSTQDIVECSEYSQGCNGGFPYLVSGKYAEDFGLVEESCNPYTGMDGKCHTKQSCTRQYSTSYHYVGGFYGACNEALMKIELVKFGPMSVSFEVYDDFLSYKGGIYYHTGLKDHSNFRFEPFELTNHAVLLVGYGSENGVDYWIVKNSWGTSWGEDGFFRIRRGSDECAIESIAVGSDFVL